MSNLTSINIRKPKKSKTKHDEKVIEEIENKLKNEESNVEVYSPKLRVIKSTKHTNDSTNVVERDKTKKSKESSSKKNDDTSDIKTETQSLYRKEFIEDKTKQEFYKVKTDVVPKKKIEKPVEKKGFFSSFKRKN